MRKFIKEFKAFIVRGNVLDLAVAVIIGGAFQKIIASLVEDVIMPCVSFLTGKVDYVNHFIALNGEHYDSLVQAKAAQAITINYGVFISALINFVLMALVIFTLIKIMSNFFTKSGLKKAEDAQPLRLCEYCKSEINPAATRCPHCTSKLS